MDLAYKTGKEDEVPEGDNPAESNAGNIDENNANNIPENTTSDEIPNSNGRLLSKSPIPKKRFLTEESQTPETPPPTEESISSSSSYTTVSEVLSINRRLAKNSILSAEIIGDYMPLKPPPSLKDKIFLRPLPREVPIDAEGKSQNDWLIVDQNMVSMDGADCDKIGK